ncbi:MAG: DegV family protein [Omnitrophica WOR_2 bacterium]
MSIAIVTDSTADIPHDLAEANHIQIMPNIIIIDGQEIQDDASFSRADYYSRLPEMKTLPTTATASSGSYIHLYETLFQQGYNQIISIHASSLLSGIYNAASAAAQNFQDRVNVVDSGQVTLALGFQVLMAAEAAANGVPKEQILRMLNNVRPRSRVIAMLDTMEYIRRSGRVSWALASIGNLFHIKPFIELREGKISSLGEVRTRGKGIERLVEIFRKLGSVENFAILHSNAEEDANRLKAMLDSELHDQPLVVNVTTIIGTHVGPNGLGYAVILK